MDRRDVLKGLLLCGAGGGLAPAVAATPAKKRKPAKSRTTAAPPTPYRVICFTGWIIPLFDSMYNSPVTRVVERLTQQGIPAELRGPDDDIAVFQTLMVNPSLVTLMGYSLGAAAAIRLANRLAEADRSVRSLVLLEETDAPKVSAPTRVTHYYASGSGARVAPADDFTGVLRNIDIADVDVRLAGEGHLSVARIDMVLDLITRNVIDGS